MNIMYLELISALIEKNYEYCAQFVDDACAEDFGSLDVAVTYKKLIIKLIRGTNEVIHEIKSKLLTFLFDNAQSLEQIGTF